MLWIPPFPYRAPLVSVTACPSAPVPSPTVSGAGKAWQSTARQLLGSVQGHKESCAGIGEVPRRGGQVEGSCCGHLV